MLIACSNCATTPHLEPAMLSPATRCAFCGSAWLAAPRQAAEEVTGQRASEEFAADLEWIEPAEPDPVASIDETGATPEASPAKGEAADTERDRLRKLAEALEAAPAFLPSEPPIPVVEPASSAFDIVPEPLGVTGTAAPDIAPDSLSKASELDVMPRRAGEILAAAPAIMPAIARMKPVAHSLRQPQKPLRRRDFANFDRSRQRQLAPQQPWRLPRPGLPAAILTLLAAASVVIAGRSEIVRQAPQTASLYAAIGLPVNLRGLDFDDVKTARENQEGVNVLVI